MEGEGFPSEPTMASILSCPGVLEKALMESSWCISSPGRPESERKLLQLTADSYVMNFSSPIVVSLPLSLKSSISALLERFFTPIRRQKRRWRHPTAAQAQGLVHSALQGRARGVVAARERTDAFSSVFLKGGGKSADTASLAHGALSYTPLWKIQALP